MRKWSMVRIILAVSNQIIGGLSLRSMTTDLKREYSTGTLPILAVQTVQYNPRARSAITYPMEMSTVRWL